MPAPAGDFQKAVRAEAADSVPGGRVPIDVDEGAEGVHRRGRASAREGSAVDVEVECEGADVVRDAEPHEVDVPVDPRLRGHGDAGDGAPVRERAVDRDGEAGPGTGRSKEGEKEEGDAKDGDQAEPAGVLVRLVPELARPQAVREPAPV